MEEDIYYRVMKYLPSEPDILYSVASFRGDADEEHQTNIVSRKGIHVDTKGIGFFATHSQESARYWVEQSAQDAYAYGIFRVVGKPKPNPDAWAGDIIDEMEILEEVETFPPTRTHSDLALKGKQALSGLYAVLQVPDSIKYKLISQGNWKPFNNAEIKAAIDEGLATDTELNQLAKYNSYFT